MVFEEWCVTGRNPFPILFNIYINSVIENIARSGIGCRMGVSVVSIIAYADDLVILCPSANGLRKLMGRLYEEIKTIKLELNFNKSVCMVFKPNTNVKIMTWNLKLMIEILKLLKM